MIFTTLPPISKRCSRKQKLWLAFKEKWKFLEEKENEGNLMFWQYLPFYYCHKFFLKDAPRAIKLLFSSPFPNHTLIIIIIFQDHQAKDEVTRGHFKVKRNSNYNNTTFSWWLWADIILLVEHVTAPKKFRASAITISGRLPLFLL